MSRISGKCCLVTGGTRGIGLALGRALLERGARLFICGRDGKAVRETTASLSGEFGSPIFGQACDLRAERSVASMFESMERQLEGLDILINNAGIGIFRNVADMAPEEWRATLETNLSGVFYCCREAIPRLRQRGGGYIINIGSLAGKNAFPGGAAYNASKFGLIGFSEALMQEVRYDHIRVSYVMPGSVNTEFGSSTEQDPASTWKLLPEDVAQVVVGLLEMDPRALPSRVELRPSEPRK